MMRAALKLAQIPVLLTIALVVLLLVLPGRSELIARVYVLAVSAFVLVQLVTAMRRALPASGPSAFDAALRPRTRSAERLPELAKIEREVALGSATAFDLHYRLRPSLRRIAGELLAARRGIDLDTEPDAARRALGEETWEIVRGDREPPRERFAAGADLASLHVVVRSLEAL